MSASNASRKNLQSSVSNQIVTICESVACFQWSQAISLDKCFLILPRNWVGVIANSGWQGIGRKGVKTKTSEKNVQFPQFLMRYHHWGGLLHVLLMSLLRDILRVNLLPWRIHFMPHSSPLYCETLCSYVGCERIAWGGKQKPSICLLARIAHERRCHS